MFDEMVSWFQGLMLKPQIGVLITPTISSYDLVVKCEKVYDSCVNDEQSEVCCKYLWIALTILENRTSDYLSCAYCQRVEELFSTCRIFIPPPSSE